MPPRRRNGSKAAGSPTPDSTSPPLAGCCITFSGSFPGQTQASLLALAANLGADTKKTMAATVTHLVTTQADFDKLTTKVIEAEDRGIFIVSLDWILATASGSRKPDESLYNLHATPSSAPPAPPAPKKRQASDTPASEPKRSKLEASSGDTPAIGKSQVAKNWAVQVPVDEGCTLAGYGVHIDDDSVIWDATLK